MKEIRWGIAGAGAIAGQFAEGLYYAPGARLQAVASRDAARAAEFAGRFGVPKAFESYEKLCADPDVDIVYVATPNEHHYSHTMLAIEAGKAVLCEKPFALDAMQAREMFAAARRRGVFCMEGMWMRCSPAFQSAVGLARTGRLGDLTQVTAQIGFANIDDGVSRLFRPGGGGALLDLGVYALAATQALLGRPARVLASAAIGSTGVDEWVSIVLEYSGGRQGVVSASIRSHLANSVEVYGTGARLKIETPIYFPTAFSVEGIVPASPARAGRPGLVARLRRKNLARWMEDVARKARTRLKTHSTHQYPRGTGLTCEAEEVMRCLRAGLAESPLVTQADSLEVLEIMDDVRRVWQSGRGAPA